MKSATVTPRTSQRRRRRGAVREDSTLPSLYRALVQQAPDHLLALDADGHIEFVNRTAPLFTGKQVIGSKVSDHIGADPQRIDEAVVRVVTTGVEERHNFYKDLPDRSRRWYRARLQRFEDGEVGAKVLLFIRETTERHLAEQALRKTVRELEESRRQVLQAQKMESIGRLAGGVAHDFNNLLTAIISFSRFVMDDLAPGDPRRADLVEVLKAADSAARLTSQLLAFSRKRPVEPALLDLNQSVLRISRVLQRTLEASVHLRITESAEPTHVMFDPGQLDQLLMNLAVNARDAMPEGGTLTVQIGSRRIRGHRELSDGDYAALRISDTGTGMTDEVMSQIFEPFFTTKGDKGTGLGLATCYGIVKQAQGHIDVETECGKGSAFTVFLPLVSRPPETRVEAPELVPDSKLSGLVLVVEDQSPIRLTMMRSLAAVGFNVIEARTAEEALTMVSDLQAKLSLLVTDVMLPGQSGIKLAEQLRREQPELRVLVCSGYMGHEQDTGIVLNDRTAFLPKPFTGPQLALKARGLFG
jgi:two-component system, cell cycle sensor histidine kinase and response regulator CckA